MKKVTLAHGNGGVENLELIDNIFFKHFKNELLLPEDAAILELYSKKIALTTDSFVISPIFFKGGDIGKLSICGTCNDLAVKGAKPTYLSASFVIEEGFDIESLEKIAISMANELKKIDAKVVAGDTKVVPKGSVDGIFITTTGIGELLVNNLSSSSLEIGDIIIVSNYIGEHGASIFAEREGIELSGELKSDCTLLWSAIKSLIDANVAIKTMRDATRGGVASVLNEWARASFVEIEINEASVPISDSVMGVCEILGFEPYTLACEGVFLLALKESEANRALEVLKKDFISKNCAIIGRVTSSTKPRVVLKSPYGTKRILEYPSGELLPRIC